MISGLALEVSHYVKCCYNCCLSKSVLMGRFSLQCVPLRWGRHSMLFINSFFSFREFPYNRNKKHALKK